MKVSGCFYLFDCVFGLAYRWTVMVLLYNEESKRSREGLSLFWESASPPSQEKFPMEEYHLQKFFKTFSLEEEGWLIPTPPYPFSYVSWGFTDKYSFIPEVLAEEPQEDCSSSSSQGSQGSSRGSSHMTSQPEAAPEPSVVKTRKIVTSKIT